jgi:hypothetical protein
MADLLKDLLDGAEPITWAEERIALVVAGHPFRQG